MKVSILQENLTKALATVSRVVPTRTQLPVLQNILIQTRDNRIYFAATSLDTTIVYGCDGKTEEEGSVCVPSRLFGEFVATLPAQPVALKTEDTGLAVACADFHAVLTTSPVGEFPPVPSIGQNTQTSVAAKELSQALGLVLFAAATDETRPILSGVRFAKASTGVVVTATDGYRLSRKSLPLKLEEDVDVVIPARALAEVTRLSKEAGQEGTLGFVFTPEGQLMFAVGEAELYTRRIDGEYPSVEKIIPTTHTTRAVFDRESLMQAVKSAAIFARDNANIVRLTVQKNSIVVSANAPSVGENKVEVEANVDGEGGEIAFNSRFLMEYFGAVSADQIVFEMTGSLNPGAFRLLDDDTYLHIIMPVRVQG